MHYSINTTIIEYGETYGGDHYRSVKTVPTFFVDNDNAESASSDAFKILNAMHFYGASYDDNPEYDLVMIVTDTDGVSTRFDVGETYLQYAEKYMAEQHYEHRTPHDYMAVSDDGFIYQPLRDMLGQHGPEGAFLPTTMPPSWENGWYCMGHYPPAQNYERKLRAFLDRELVVCP